MYPLHCTGGFAMPIRSGKFEIVGVGLNLDAVSTDYELSLWDTGVNAIVDHDNPPADARRIFHANGDGAGPEFFSFPEPIKVRSGISVGVMDNIEVGELYIYVR